MYKCKSSESSKIWHTPFASSINSLDSSKVKCITDDKDDKNKLSTLDDQNFLAGKFLNNSNNIYCIYIQNCFIANKILAEKYCPIFKSMKFKDAQDLEEFNDFSILNTNNGIFIFEKTLPKIYAVLRVFIRLRSSNFLTLSMYLSKITDENWLSEEFESALRRLDYFGIKTDFKYQHLNPFQQEDLSQLHTYTVDQRLNNNRNLDLENETSNKHSKELVKKVSPDFYKKNIFIRKRCKNSTWYRSKFKLGIRRLSCNIWF